MENIKIKIKPWQNKHLDCVYSPANEIGNKDHWFKLFFIITVILHLNNSLYILF